MHHKNVLREGLRKEMRQNDTFLFLVNILFTSRLGQTWIDWSRNCALNDEQCTQVVKRSIAHFQVRLRSHFIVVHSQLWLAFGMVRSIANEPFKSPSVSNRLASASASASVQFKFSTLGASWDGFWSFWICHLFGASHSLSQAIAKCIKFNKQQIDDDDARSASLIEGNLNVRLLWPVAIIFFELWTHLILSFKMSRRHHRIQMDFRWRRAIFGFRCHSHTLHVERTFHASNFYSEFQAQRRNKADDGEWFILVYCFFFLFCFAPATINTNQKFNHILSTNYRVCMEWAIAMPTNKTLIVR